MALDLTKIDLNSFGIEEDAQLKNNVTESIKVNPDQHSTNLNLSKQSGVPAFAVESAPEEVENQLKLDKIDLSTMTTRAPKTSKFLSSDVNNTIIAQEDIFSGVLESIEETFSGIGESIQKGFGIQARGTALAFTEQVPDKVEDIVSPAMFAPFGALGMLVGSYFTDDLSKGVASSFGIESDEELMDIKSRVSDKLITEVQTLQAEKQSLTPEDLSIVQEGVRAGVESLANMLPGIGLSVLSGGSAAPLLLTIGAQTFAGSYGDARAEGLSVEKARWFAAVDAAIEVGTEILPTGTIQKMLTGKSTGITKQAMKFAVQEMGTEQLATALQTINAVSFDMDAELANAQTADEIVNIQLRRQAVTAIATIVAGGTQITAATAVNKTITKLTETEQSKEVQAENEQVALDKINEDSSKSKLRERDVETFKQFVKEADGDNNTQVYIDGAQASLYLQSKTEAEIAADPALKALKIAAQESQAIGTDVVIPVEQFAAEIAGTEHYEALRESMTMSEATVSQFQQEAHAKDTKDYITTIMDEAQGNASEYVEAQEIFTKVRDQLIDTGTVSAANASVMAQIVPAWATAQAKRTGTSVGEVFKSTGFTVEGPLTGERERLEGEVFNQPAVQDQQTADDVISEISDFAEVNEGLVTVYHRTSKEAADKIRESGKMQGKEDGLFFSTKKDGEATGFGDAVIEFKIPADQLRIDDIFEDEAHLILTATAGKPTEIKDLLTVKGEVFNQPVQTVREVQSPVTEDQTETEEFKEWFGTSKLVDENGKPLTMYHGSPDASFTSFKEDQFFTSDRNYAERFLSSSTSSSSFSGVSDKNPAVFDVYIKSENPFDTRDTEHAKILKDEFSGVFGEGVLTNKGLPDWVEGRDIAEFLRDELPHMGFDSVIVDEGKDESGQRPEAYIVFSPEQIKSAQNIGTFDATSPDIFKQNQPGTGKARGYYDPANSIIRLTEASDLSTFLHEFAHFTYEMESRTDTGLNQSINNWYKRNSAEVAKEATSYLTNDSSVSELDITTYLDTGTTGNADTDASIRRATHEQFARGFETYLMEGKAPSIELRNAFRTFARWLGQIYQAMGGKLNVNLDNDMRQVFDRLLATEEQIAAAEARARIEPMFTEPTEGVINEEELASYNARQEKVKDVQSEQLRDKIVAELTRKTEKWWKEEKADLVDIEKAKLEAEPIYIARKRLRLKNGDIKLDHATVKEAVGEHVTNAMGHKSHRLPPMLNRMTAKGQQGVHPDQAAAFFGFSSGAALLDKLISTPTLEDTAKVNAEAEMLALHGDILNDGTIEQQADEAVMNEERGKLILHELKILAKGTNQRTIERGMIKDLAEERIGGLSFREIHPGKYRKSEIQAAQESARMLAEGNKEGAAHAKSRQVLNYYLGMAATEAKNETVKIVDKMARYEKKKVREEIQKAEGGYWEQITRILERFEFKKSATLKNVDRVNQDINTWAAQRIDEAGDGLVLTNAVMNESYVTHWKNVAFSDLQGISDSVKNIEHVARYSNKMTRLGEEVDFNTLVAELVASAAATGTGKFKVSASKADDLSWIESKGRWAMAQMTKIPYMMSWMDGQERVGDWFNAISQPMTDAYSAELELFKEVGEPLVDMIKNRSKEDIKRHQKTFFIPEIEGTANGTHTGNMKGHEILAVALNAGNKSNLRKLLLGEQWANPDVDTDISIQNPKLQAVLSHMTLSDWNMVQDIWNQIDMLYPKMAEVHRKTTGLVPPKVEATPVVTEFGTFTGGYYPVKYDPARDNKAAEFEARNDAEVSSMFSSNASIQASVNTGAANERTGYYAPIHLTLDVVPNHIQETIHYVTHHDAIREVNRLIRDPRIKKAVSEKLGPQEFAQLKPWLNDIAKDGRNAPVKTFIDAAFNKLRLGTTLGVMGFKASTGIIQISGLSNTMAEVGTKHVFKSMRTILGSPASIQSAWEFAVTKSKILKFRTKTMDREMMNALNALSDKRGILATVQETSMKHIGLIQTYMVDLPSWHAAYTKELENSGDEVKALAYADWVIENVQGSGATKDMAGLMRNQSKIQSTMTMFMTFFSALWNLERDLVKGAKSNTYSVTTVAAKSMFLFTIPVLFEMIMRGEFSKEDEDDEELLQEVLTKVALFPIASVPFVRDVANIASGFGYNASPVTAMIEQGLQGFQGMAKAVHSDGDFTKAQIKSASKLIGAGIGLPGTGQAWVTGEHLYDVIAEGEDFTAHQFLFGPARK